MFTNRRIEEDVRAALGRDASIKTRVANLIEIR